MLGTKRQPLPCRLVADDVVEQPVKLVRVLDALAARCEALFVPKLGQAGKLEESVPVVGAVRQHDDPAVPGTPRAPVRRADARITEIPVLRPKGLAAEVLDEALTTGNSTTLQRYPTLLAAEVGQFHKVGRLSARFLGRPGLLRPALRLGLRSERLMGAILRIAANDADAVSTRWVGAFNPFAVYDVAGRLVATLLDRRVGAGEASVPWNGTDAAGRRVASGAYVLRLESDAGTATRKVLRLR